MVKSFCFVLECQNQQPTSSKEHLDLRSTRGFFVFGERRAEVSKFPRLSPANSGHLNKLKFAVRHLLKKLTNYFQEVDSRHCELRRLTVINLGLKVILERECAIKAPSLNNSILNPVRQFEVRSRSFALAITAYRP